MSDALNFAIRTPNGVVFDQAVRAARVVTETGLVGLRPRGELIVLAVEPGLVVLRLDEGLHFAATAGGLLASDRERCTLFTPFAVAGSSEQEMLEALGAMLATPSSELVARQRLGELEQRIIRELHKGPGVVAGSGRQHGGTT